MSGTGVRHLQRRDGIYHLRMRVPDDVRQIVGLREIRRSLGSCGVRTARRLVAIYAARIQEAYEVIRTQGKRSRPGNRRNAVLLHRFGRGRKKYDRFLSWTNMADQEIDW